VEQLPEEHEPDDGIVTRVLAFGPIGWSGFTSGPASMLSMGVSAATTSSDSRTVDGAASTIDVLAGTVSECTYSRTAPMPMMGTTMQSVSANLAVLEYILTPRVATSGFRRCKGRSVPVSRASTAVSPRFETSHRKERPSCRYAQGLCHAQSCLLIRNPYRSRFRRS